MTLVVTPLSVAMESPSVSDVNELYERWFVHITLANQCQRSCIFGSFYIKLSYWYLTQFLLCLPAGRHTTFTIVHLADAKFDPKRL